MIVIIPELTTGGFMEMFQEQKKILVENLKVLSGNNIFPKNFIELIQEKNYYGVIGGEVNPSDWFFVIDFELKKDGRDFLDKEEVTGVDCLSVPIYVDLRLSFHMDDLNNMNLIVVADTFMRALKFNLKGEPSVDDEVELWDEDRVNNFIKEMVRDASARRKVDWDTLTVAGA